MVLVAGNKDLVKGVDGTSNRKQRPREGVDGTSNGKQRPRERRGWY